jgi:putative DNA primase/helicase
MHEKSWQSVTSFAKRVVRRRSPGLEMDRSRLSKRPLRIEHLLVTNEFSDRVYDLRDGDTKTVRNLLAYRKVGVEKVGVEKDTEEFWVPPTVFDKEFTVGVNKAELVKELQRLGWLLPPRPDGKAIHTRSVYGKRIYLYVFRKRENVREQGEQGISNPLSEP